MKKKKFVADAGVATCVEMQLVFMQAGDSC
jgi:hypothetical protein